MSDHRCPRCERPLDSGRVQWNGQIWCFDCSMDPHDVRVRMQKMDGTFAAPRVVSIELRCGYCDALKPGSCGCER